MELAKTANEYGSVQLEDWNWILSRESELSPYFLSEKQGSKIESLGYWIIWRSASERGAYNAVPDFFLIRLKILINITFKQRTTMCRGSTECIKQIWDRTKLGWNLLYFRTEGSSYLACYATAKVHRNLSSIENALVSTIEPLCLFLCILELPSLLII